MKTGVISAARGSAYLELNKTKIICGVYGPRQIAGEFSDKGRLNCDFKMTSFSADHRRSKNPSTVRFHPQALATKKLRTHTHTRAYLYLSIICTRCALDNNKTKQNKIR
eukprot:GEZU01021335.1.p1 GENE.GEZU01021335.1~~GEZU01021335.1.p1  ORF type:complete len:109 (+),score=2.52 GEZU01021335.1:3-329(+)